MKMFAPEGYTLMALAVLLSILLIVSGWYLGGWWKAVLMVVGVLLSGFVFYFFRDPERHPPPDADTLILAPADGEVILIEEVDEPLYLKGRARQISIFLSPLDVHVNRIPVTGVVEYVDYVPGDYLVAWHPKASERNERSVIGVHHPSCRKVLFKQIAGLVARRIVFHVQKGDTVHAGERFGIVKFGSRMDVLFPLDVEVVVNVGDRVKAGESVLARIPAVSPPTAAEALLQEEQSR